MQQLIGLLDSHGSLLVFAVTLIARVGLPVPAAPLLVVAGGLVASGSLSWAAVLASSVAANLAGDAAWFYAGRHKGHRIMRLLCRVSLSPDACVRQSEDLIARRGGSALLAAKFLPGISVVAAPMAGALGMPLARFIGFDTLAGALWTLVYLLPGVLFSGQIQAMLDTLAQAGGMAGLALAVTALLWLGVRALRRWAFMRSMAMARIGAHELHALLGREPAPVVIDVRSATSAVLDPRRIPGALPIGLQDMGRHAAQLPRDRDIVVYCNCPNEVSAVRAAQILARHGLRRVRPLRGGLDGWNASGYPLTAD